MIRVTYDPLHGFPVKDGLLDAEVQDIIFRAPLDNLASALSGDRSYSTTNIITRIRVAVAEGEINCNDLVFVFKGEELKVSPNGTLAYWPKGFDTDTDLMTRLLDGRRKQNG